jgi:hypothetical protein
MSIRRTFQPYIMTFPAVIDDWQVGGKGWLDQLGCRVVMDKSLIRYQNVETAIAMESLSRPVEALVRVPTYPIFALTPGASGKP